MGAVGDEGWLAWLYGRVARTAVWWQRCVLWCEWRAR